MVQHVHERAVESGAEEVIIATDNEHIAEAADKFKATVCMTSVAHLSGTDRIAEVASINNWSPETIVINLQGDEPLMNPKLIKQVADDLEKYKDAGIATLCAPITTTAELFDPHVVKVIMDHQGYALYFSRATIPWDRKAFAETQENLPEESLHYRHVGLYGYRVDFLGQYSKMKTCYPEQAESLEQLRALYNGIKIHVSTSEASPGHGVDTQEDLDRVALLLKAEFKNL